jgi:hypothetical protein
MELAPYQIVCPANFFILLNALFYLVKNGYQGLHARVKIQN